MPMNPSKDKTDTIRRKSISQTSANQTMPRTPKKSGATRSSLNSSNNQSGAQGPSKKTNNLKRPSSEMDMQDPPHRQQATPKKRKSITKRAAKSESDTDSDEEEEERDRWTETSTSPPSESSSALDSEIQLRLELMRRIFGHEVEADYVDCSKCRVCAKLSGKSY